MSNEKLTLMTKCIKFTLIAEFDDQERDAKISYVVVCLSCKSSGVVPHPRETSIQIKKYGPFHLIAIYVGCTNDEWMS